MPENLFGRLTPRVKDVLRIARVEADKYGHRQIETEDLLLAILEYGQGVAIDVLHYLKIDPARLRMEMEKNMKIGGIPGEPSLGDSIKNVLGHAYHQAQEFGHNYVGTEHLLIGLIILVVVTAIPCVGWLLKLIIMRYGGLRLYRIALPFFGVL